MFRELGPQYLPATKKDLRALRESLRGSFLINAIDRDYYRAAVEAIESKLANV